ncbi:hypothetical protein Tco_0140006 [Tanacetum coccineum]
MLRDFNREDIEDLWKLMKSKYGSAKPKDDLDYVLWNDLKNMFEPDLEDSIWRRQDGYKVLEWKLYESCGIHFLRINLWMMINKFRGGLLGIKSSTWLQLLSAAVLSYYCLQQINTASSRLTTVDRVTTAGWIKSKIT